MNKKQKLVFLVGAGIIVLMGLMPPWYYRAAYPEGERIYTVSIPASPTYGFLFSPPDMDLVHARIEGQPHVPCIDLRRLFVQWVAVAIATTGIILTLKRK
jgi:hypothetical protein